MSSQSGVTHIRFVARGNPNLRVIVAENIGLPLPG